MAHLFPGSSCLMEDPSASTPGRPDIFRLWFQLRSAKGVQISLQSIPKGKLCFCPCIGLSLAPADFKLLPSETATYQYNSNSLTHWHCVFFSLHSTAVSRCTKLLLIAKFTALLVNKTEDTVFSSVSVYNSNYYSIAIIIILNIAFKIIHTELMSF